MEKNKLLAMAEDYAAKAEKYYRNYQETGMSRYFREHRKAEELSEALYAAAHAADDHNKMLHLRSVLLLLASKAKLVQQADDKGIVAQAVCSELLSMARMEGLMDETD